MYHRIADESFDPWGLAVSPGHFAEQLDWLAQRRTILPLTEFAARHREQSLPADALALTFDDGYECAASIAAPMLEQRALPATIFIPADLIDRGRPFWWDELKDILLFHDADVLILSGDQISLGAREPEDGSWMPGAPARTTRQKGFARIWARLREKPPRELDEAMEELRSQSAATPGPSALPMSPAQVRAIRSDRIQFGSHALTHPWLSSLTAVEKAREIQGSVDRCEQLMGARPMLFAYPYGDFDAESERLVKEAGFECACATIPTAVSRDSRVFALPRIQVGNWDAGRLAQVLSRTA